MLAAALAGLLAPPSTALAAERPTSLLPNSLLPSPGIHPPRANDFGCEPTAEHPFPVVLVHGTLEDQTISWLLASPAIKRHGYCVFALDYGHRGTDPIQDSAIQLRDFVDRVREATGAERVSIVGHSQGGLMARYYIKFLGGAEAVDDLIGLAPSNHGTTLALAAPVGNLICPACTQQAAGSDFLAELDVGDETPGPVSYTQVETRYDEIVMPYTSAFLAPGPNTTNVLLQDACPLDLSDHVLITHDPVAIDWAIEALDRPGPADPAFRPNCLLGGLVR